MSPAGLRVRDVAAGENSVRIEVTSPTRGVAVVDVLIGAEATPAPLHWRAGDWTKPPVDVSLAHDGRPRAIQVVFQDEEVSVGDAPRSIDLDTGVPSFEVGSWPPNRYLDSRTDLRTTRLRSGELIVSMGDDYPIRRLRLSADLALGIDAAGELVEIEIGPLDEEQWRTIAAASP